MNANTTQAHGDAAGYYTEGGKPPAPYVVDGITITPMNQVFASEEACDEYHRLERLVELADDLIEIGVATSETHVQRRRVIRARERAAQLDWTPAEKFVR